MTNDERFLERWSRRKATARTDKAEQAPADALEPKAEAPLPAENTAAPQAIDPDTLPDIDSLDENSDFSIFMQDGVPDALRNRALRKLWQIDPAFNVVDGLLEYGEDFTDLAAVAEAVQTVYKVGKGMVSESDEPEETAKDESETDAASEAADQTAAGNPAAVEAPKKDDVALNADIERPLDDSEQPATPEKRKK